MQTLRECIYDYKEQGKAIAHFNFATFEMADAILEGRIRAGLKAGTDFPLILGTAEGERDFMGIQNVVRYVDAYKKETGHPVFLNADHTYSVERAKEAIDAGFDMVVIDFAAKSYEENVEATREVVRYRDMLGSNCLIEAELGFIGAGSDIKDTVPEGVSEATMTKPEEAKMFLDETGIDLFAPSVGNVHGIVTSGQPRLNPERVEQLMDALNIPLVLHGGSGSSNEDFVAVIKKGISIIHISTELRVAFKDALVLALQGKDLQPYKYMKEPMNKIAEIVEDRVLLFSLFNQN